MSSKSNEQKRRARKGILARCTGGNNWACSDGRVFPDDERGAMRHALRFAREWGRPLKVELVRRFPVRNAMRCTWCRGRVDRHEHMFVCRDCGAIGDLLTGTMSPSRREVA